MISADELTVMLLIVAVAMFLLALAILLYCCALMLEVRDKIKLLPKLPAVPRDHNGRRIQERL